MGQQNQNPWFDQSDPRMHQQSNQSPFNAQYDNNQNAFTAKFGPGSMGHIKEEDFRSKNHLKSMIPKYPQAQPAGVSIREQPVRQSVAQGNQVMRISNLNKSAINNLKPGKRKRGKRTLTDRGDDRRGGKVKLPVIESAYLRHPGEGTELRNVRLKPSIR